ncbi:MAG: AraC family transcriptional regulator [Solobacterium sp.]|nr:AraC family transcriptional regulator [Solobacterium sp.]
MKKGIYITDNIITENAEQIHYKDSYIPYYIIRTYGRLPGTSGIMHWHQDIEISVVLRGTLNLEVGGVMYHIPEGNGIFVNAKEIHGGTSYDCDHICLRLNPILLCVNEYYEQNYVTPLLNHPDLRVLVLDQQTQWKKQIIEMTEEIYMFDAAGEEGMPLLIERYFFDIWQILYRNCPPKKHIPAAESVQMTTLKNMMGFIQENYREQIRLKDIAEAGNVSVSTCSNLFSRLIHQSPVSYLLTYRLHEAQKLLRQTGLSITEIASATGFNGSSYFAEIFRRETGMTPGQYRVRSREQDQAKPARMRQ